MPVALELNKFLELSLEHPVIDVRTPAEFDHGKFPGAHNIPLMDNVERAIVGTVYKQAGKQPAILKGLEFAGPHLKDLIKKAKKIPNKGTFLVHCWRGGMRSGFYAWLLEFYGFKVFTLKGGYKTFRNHALHQLNKKLNLVVIGGKTGSGKTNILHELKKRGEQIIDLEFLARHKGSSFGALGQESSPSQEMFENFLAMEISKLDTGKRTWIEDESRMIGNKVIPEALWNQMRETRMFFIEIPFEKRLDFILEDYGKFHEEDLIAATLRIEKRIGPEQCKLAIEALKKGDKKTGFSFSLKYYDKAYLHNFSKRENEIITIEYDDTNAEKVAEILLKQSIVKNENFN